MAPSSQGAEPAQYPVRLNQTHFSDRQYSWDRSGWTSRTILKYGEFNTGATAAPPGPGDYWVFVTPFRQGGGQQGKAHTRCLPTVSLNSTAITVDEGMAISIDASLDVAPTSTASVEVDTSGGTPSGDNCVTDADFAISSSTLAFVSGSTAASITVTACNDTDTDTDDEIVALELIPTGINGLELGSPIAVVVSITDDDDPLVRVNFGQAPYTLAESDDATTTAVQENQTTVTVTLSADPERTVVIPITATGQGGATSADYSGVPASVTFNSGETSKTFTFTATDDTDDDGESVKLSFGTLPARVSAGTTNEATVTITDDDTGSSNDGWSL